MTPIFVEFTLSNGGALLLSRTTVVGYGGFDLSFWVGGDARLLRRYEINASIFQNLLLIASFSHWSLACWFSYLVCCIKLQLT